MCAPNRCGDFFLLQIPIRGEAYIKLDNQVLCCNPKQAVMISPNLDVDMRFSAGCEQLIVRIEQCDLERHLEAQLGRCAGEPLEFDPAVSLGTPGAQQITALLQLVVASVFDGEGICSSPIPRKHLISLLLSGLINCLDHNYRSQLGGGSLRPKPAYISKAEDYIQRNVREAIGPEDIAIAANVRYSRAVCGLRIGAQHYAHAVLEVSTTRSGARRVDEAGPAADIRHHDCDGARLSASRSFLRSLQGALRRIAQRDARHERRSRQTAVDRFLIACSEVGRILELLGLGVHSMSTAPFSSRWAKRGEGGNPDE